MRLKEIKPGMAIHCITREQIAEIRKTGIRGLNQIDIENYMTPPCYVIIHRNYATYAVRADDVKKLYPDVEICEFDDLIIPEPSAEEEYNRGLNDAWELAKKIALDISDGGMREQTMTEIFGGAWTVSCVLTKYTPQEALAKFEAYEKEREYINVGDVVNVKSIAGSNYIGVITQITDNQNCACIVYSDGSVEMTTRNNMTKTGKHIDIETLLKQITE